MVKFRRRGRGKNGHNLPNVVALVVFSLVGMLFWYQNTLYHLLDEVIFFSNPTLFSSSENADEMKKWRQNLRDKCQQAKTREEALAIKESNKVGFTMPDFRTEQPRDDRAVKHCNRVVMDLGANVGDTSGHVIDSGMVGCERKDLGVSLDSVHFNLETKQFEDAKRLNPITRQLVHLMSVLGEKVGPEDYCYYGVEGNPVFTKRLQEIEDHVMAIRPRPIQHMHFFTDTVGAGEDGPTKLYLDTVNSEHNFWGSSIYKDHQDVRKSAEESNTTVVAADVMGYTIGTLMRKSLKAFDPDATAEEKKGNHLMLKVDIEGGEYPLLNQAVQDGTLCEFVKMGNQADLFIEFHSQRVTGKNQLIGRRKSMEETLTACGVNFRNLQAWWA